MALQIDYQITADIENKRISYGDDKSSACDDCRIPIILQGEDSSRRLVIRFQHNNETVDISDCTAQVKCRINNRLIADRSCEITDNAVIVMLTADMSNQNGTLEVQITLCDINGAVLSSPILKLAVKESIPTGEVEQTEDFSVLQDLAKKIEPITSEVKDARGGYALLGDRISALEAAGINALSFKGAKNCVRHSAGFTSESVGSDSFYTTGLTLSAEDGCAVAEGTAGAPCSVYALFDEPITLARDSSRQVLAVMRIKAVQSDLRVYPLAGRYSGYYNYLCDSNIIESNITEHIGTNSYVQPLKKGEWLTIWALLGDTGKSFKLGGDETQLNGLGVYIPAQTDGTAPKLMIQSVCAYVSDSEERDLLNEVRNSVNAISGRLSIAEGRIDDNARVIENLQTSTDNTNKAVASLSEAVNNSSDRVAEVKSVVEDMQRNLSELSTGGFNDKKAFEALQTIVAENGERLAEAENDISDIQASIGTMRENIETHTNTDIALNNRITELEIKATKAADDVSDIKANIGLGDEVLGLQVDFENKSFTRLAGAVNLNAGADFDNFEMFGGRRRCNVFDDGTITAYYGDENYAEDGSNGQVMVYQPAFYYKVVPVIYDENKESGIGYHLRKANYYVTSRPHAGFKLHPAFIGEDGHKVDYILYSAYEGCIFDSSEDDYLRNDEQITDFDADSLSSISGSKPVSGKEQNLTMSNAEKLASNRGAGWHIDTVKSVSANQLLMMIEYGTMNMQSAVGQGIVKLSDVPSDENNSLTTGATATLGNTTGQADGENGLTAISYRGVENVWGNIWKYVEGVNIWGDGTMSGGQPYIANNYNFSESTHSGDYLPTGFTLPNSDGFIKAIGYGSENYDWLMIPSEIGGTSVLPVGDYTWIVSNLNGYKTARIGGRWSYTNYSGCFAWHFNSDRSVYNRGFGCRLTYVPKK
ncbi:MAG: hypothetical protein ACI4F2_09830 [Acutalibacteraceae bacterium]